MYADCWQILSTGTYSYVAGTGRACETKECLYMQISWVEEKDRKAEGWMHLSTSLRGNQLKLNCRTGELHNLKISFTNEPTRRPARAPCGRESIWRYGFVCLYCLFILLLSLLYIHTLSIFIYTYTYKYIYINPLHVNFTLSSCSKMMIMMMMINELLMTVVSRIHQWRGRDEDAPPMWELRITIYLHCIILYSCVLCRT